MEDVLKQMEELSPEQRRLLELMLEERAAERARLEAAQDPEGAIPRRAPGDPLVLSYAQQRLWFIHQMQPGLSAYNIPSAVRIEGRLDVAVLERAVNEIVRRHETLRTRFGVEGGRPVPVIEPELRVPLEVEDLAVSAGSRAEAEAEAKRRVDRLARTPFDLAADVLLRVHLFAIGEGSHLLLVVMHHTVADTWTTGVFLREVAALYSAFSRGEPSPLPAPPIQYADYALWQRRMLEEEDGFLQRQMEFWKEELAGAPQLLELPTDRPRPPVQSFRGGRVMLFLPRESVERLKRLAGEEDATFFMVLLATFQLLLRRYTGQHDVLVGSPIANRDRMELEGLIGLFVNTLVLRCDLSGEPSFRTLLGQVRSRCLQAFAHHDLPFERLVEVLDLDRSTSRNPLFQVLFAFQNVPLPRLEAEGLTLTRFEFEESTARLDLELDLQEMEEGVVGWIGYNAELFDRSTVARMTRHYVRLLGSVVETPDDPVGLLRLLDRSETQQVLRGWNDTAATVDRGATLHGSFEAQVARAPEAVAVEAADADGGRWTYRQLEERANRLARLLRDEGVRPGSHVGVYLRRGAVMLEAVLGVLKAGGVYVPIGEGQPLERIRSILGGAGARHLVVDARKVGAARELAPEVDRVVCLDETAVEEEAEQTVRTRGDLDRYEGTPPGVAVPPEALAYLLFTSGSTGTPKGVMVRHASAANLVDWVNRAFAVGPHDRLLFVTSLGFDLSVYDVFGTLAAGARVRVAAGEEVRDPQRLARVLVEEGVTFWNSAPAALQQTVPFLPETLEGEGALRLVFLSGDWMPLDLPDRVRAAFPGARVVNLGGPTEATVWTNRYVVDAVDPSWVSIPYGRPVQNVRCHVLDEHLEAQPVGVAGDLYSGGACVSAGYLASPALTAGRYVPDPFSQEPGGRLYATGDRARYRADGNLEFLGRRDHQVKIRGYRIELGEVQSALSEHPAVDESAVLAREDAPGDRRLVAYLVCRSGEAPAVGELRTFLQARVPDYMVPAHFVTLEALPLTANGKLDRRALPAPETDRPDLESSFVDPQSELERRIAEVWRKVLNVDRVGRHDDFFQLGGHSLLLTQVLQELKETVAPDLQIADLFQFPTVGGLAEHLGSGGGDGGVIAESRLRAEVRAAGGSARETDVAIVGIALRVPGANDPWTFWRNLAEGVESISFFSREEVLANGVPPERASHPDFVPAEGTVDDVDGFDAAFFGYSPREAEMMDPQHRFFLECCWEALENAGYDPVACPGAVGVYGAVNVSSYLFNNLSDYDALGAMGDFHTRAALLLGNTSDFLAQRVSYHLGLKGPSVNVQTACSSTLVAVHAAAQDLVHHECDMALAGGVQMRVPQRIGYLYKEGGLPSPDGHCRSFDHRSKGTVHGNGVALVVLKRLREALADGDHVYGVIKGSAVANDAGTSVGFTAPSRDGQARAAAEALAVAGVEPETVDFVEANGTGTEMGDPIEFAALAQAYANGTGEPGRCALGSVKTNIGHLDTASGVAGLIKAVLALERGEIPPTLHFEKPNPNIDLARSPFHVNTERVPWPARERPRRAAVNNFGVGGTNAHVVLEQAPEVAASPDPRPLLLVPVSARSSPALHRATTRLAEHLETHPELPLPDVAYTLQVGRRPFPVRRLVLCRDRDDALSALRSLDPERVLTAMTEPEERPVAFLFEAGPSIPAGAAVDLWGEPAFRETVERCAGLLEPELGRDLGALLQEGAEGGGEVVDRAVLFTVQAAQAGLWRDWGLAPQAVFGQGVGAVAAAVAAGALELEEAVPLVVALARGGEGGEAVPRILDGISWKAPQALWISPRTGSPLGPEEARRPEHWTAGPAAAGGVVDRALGEVLGRARVVVTPGPSGALARVVADHPEPELVLESIPGGDRGSLESLIEGLGRAWLAGAGVSWHGFQKGAGRRRVPLPSYPFEHRRYWREPPRRADRPSQAETLSRKQAPERWLYTPSWRRSRVLSRRHPAPGSRWLVFDDGLGLGDGLAAALAGSDEVFRVVVGNEPGPRDGTGFAVRPGSWEDHGALAEHLDRCGFVPDRVVHLWGVTGPGGGEGRRGPEEVRHRTLDSVLALARELLARNPRRPLEVTVVTDGLHEVVGGEPLEPAKALVLAAVKVLPQEHPELSCRAVDVAWLEGGDGSGGPAAAVAPVLLAELARDVDEPVVALRGRHRWVQSFEPVPGIGEADGGPRGLRQGATVLVTGVPGELSLTLAEHLWETAQARLALLASPGFPRPDAWDQRPADVPEDEPYGRAVRRLQALREAGAEVVVVSADVSDPAAVAAAVAEAEQRLGGLHAVAHTAGDHGGRFAATVDEIGPETLSRRLGEKVLGLLALEQALADRELELGLVSSSLAGILGGLGVAADAAGDAFLDAWVTSRAARGERWVSLGWDAWRPRETLERVASTGSTQVTLSSDELMGALDRVLAAGLTGPVAVSATDLEARLDRWLRRKGLPEAGGGAEDGQSARPQLATAFVAPRNDLERMIAGVWQELFGIEEIGVYDDFYELGGHSLLGTQVAARLRETLEVDLPLRDFLEHTTIADLARALSETQVERADPEDLEQFLAQLEAMPDEEAALDAGS